MNEKFAVLESGDEADRVQRRFREGVDGARCLYGTCVVISPSFRCSDGAEGSWMPLVLLILVFSRLKSGLI
jgi:hypothetical protein